MGIFPRRCLCLLAICSLVPHLALGQRYTFKYYSHEQGLEDLTVSSLLQDRTGFLWLGTLNGLYRYDGARFQLVEGLPSTRIFSLAETADGTLLVATLDGLAIRAGSQFRRVGAPEMRAFPGPQSIAVTPAGKAFVAAPSGLWVSDGKPGPAGIEFRKYVLPRGVGDQGIFSSYADGVSRLWFGCDSRLCQIDGGAVRVFGEEAGVPSDHWRAIARDGKGRLWIRSATRLLVRAEGSRQFVPVKGIPESSGVESLYVDRQGRLLVSTRLGLFRGDGTRWEQIDHRNGLLVRDTSFAMQDREGSIWIGLTGAGLARWLGSGSWEHWTESEGLAGSTVKTIYRDRSGILWVGTDTSLQRFTSSGQPGRAWGQQEGLSGSPVRSITQDASGLIWFGMCPGGVGRLNPQSGELRIFGRDAGLISDRASKLQWDRDGALWVTILEGSVYRGKVSGGSVRFEPVRNPVNGEEIRRVLMARSGGAWIASRSGIFYLDGSTRKSFTQADGLPAGDVQIIGEASDGSLWFSYFDPYGVWRIMPGSIPKIVHYGKHNFLHSDDPSAVAFDAKGRAWITSDNGIDVLDGERWQHYTTDDGLLWNDCPGNAIMADADGSMWVGVNLGISHYRPPQASILAESRFPVVATWVRYGTEARDAAADIQLPYKYRSFQVGLAALTFVHDADRTFRYRMPGVQDDWVETPHGVASFSNVPAGTHTLEFMAKSGNAESVPASLSITVLPAWWQKWWFCSLEGLAGALLLWSLLNWRVRVLRRRHQQLEAAVQLRTQELSRQKSLAEEQNSQIERLLLQANENSRIKDQFLAGMSHEIRTPMNAIIGMTELALDTEDIREKHEYLNDGLAAARNMLAILNEILDLSKIEAGRIELSAACFSLRECVGHAIRTFQAAAREKDVELHEAIDDQVPDCVIGDATRVRQVLFNLLSNAIKFTERGYVAVEVRVVELGSRTARTLFSVSDTGPGIPEDKRQLIFEPFRQSDILHSKTGAGLGLAISKKLANLMGGDIVVKSRLGLGSTFFFTAQFRLQQDVPPSDSVMAGAESEVL